MLFLRLGHRRRRRLGHGRRRGLGGLLRARGERGGKADDEEGCGGGQKGTHDEGSEAVIEGAGQRVLLWAMTLADRRHISLTIQRKLANSAA
jgi:hypothetical protein